jgi:hypothetical protein
MWHIDQPSQEHNSSVDTFHGQFDGSSVNESVTLLGNGVTAARSNRTLAPRSILAYLHIGVLYALVAVLLALLCSRRSLVASCKDPSLGLYCKYVNQLRSTKLMDRSQHQQMKPSRIMMSTLVGTFSKKAPIWATLPTKLMPCGTAYTSVGACR